MSANQIVPISDPQAKAAEATATAMREAVAAFRGLGSYLQRIFGTVPEDLIGYFGGDRLKIARAENIVRILNRSKLVNDQRGVAPEPISISLALPLLVAAADESRDELVELWARLLAAAADPSRSSRFRIAFIDIVKRMDPLDAIVLRAFHRHRTALMNLQSHSETLQHIQNELKITQDELEASAFNLKKLELGVSSTYWAFGELSSLGREFLRAVGEA